MGKGKRKGEEGGDGEEGRDREGERDRREGGESGMERGEGESGKRKDRTPPLSSLQRYRTTYCSLRV